MDTVFGLQQGNPDMAALEQWIARQGLSHAEAARLLQLRSRASIGRIIRSRQACSPVVRRIYALTQGAVTPNDIFGLPGAADDAPERSAAE